MPDYFAEFRLSRSILVRHNTRVYLANYTGSKPNGVCIGAIVGKNPGSATGSSTGWGALSLSGDKLLPRVRSILLDAYAVAGKNPPENAFLQVLNLFYICGPCLATATATLKAGKGYPHVDSAERRRFPFVWFAWGGSAPILNPLKSRFLASTTYTITGAPFYYSQTHKIVVACKPTITDHARHPQGMPNRENFAVIHHIAPLL